MQLKAAQGNIVAYVRRIVSSFESAAESKNISMAFEASQPHLSCYYDADKIDKIVSNLISNALKFTESGKITIRIDSCHGTTHEKCQKKIGCVLLTISDTGKGIPQDQLPHIFNRFYQVDGSNTRHHEGTGIGLALTKELVDLHHGMIQVTSEENVGATFQINLPIGCLHLQPNEIVKTHSDELKVFDNDILPDDSDDDMPDVGVYGGKRLTQVVHRRVAIETLPLPEEVVMVGDRG